MQETTKRAPFGDDTPLYDSFHDNLPSASATRGNGRLCNTGVYNPEQGDEPPRTDALLAAEALGRAKYGRPALNGRHNEQADGADSYLGSVRLDTAHICIQGGFGESGLAAELSQMHALLARGEVVDCALLGRLECQVRLAHADHPYRLYLRLPSGIGIYAMPKYTWEHSPLLMITFPAEWCWRHSLADVRQRARQIAKDFRVNVREITVSQVHLANDLPLPLSSVLSRSWTGYSARGGSQLAYYREADGTPTGISNMTGGEKDQTFTIYDKAIRERKVGDKRGEATYFQKLWASEGSAPAQPVTRIELKAKRSRLLKMDVDQLGDLTVRNMNRVWSWFSGKYLRFADGDGQDTAAWKRVQAATFDDRPLSPEEPPVSLKKHAGEENGEPLRAVLRGALRASKRLLSACAGLVRWWSKAERESCSGNRPRQADKLGHIDRGFDKPERLA